MRICTKCRVEKPESEYFMKDKTTGRLHAQCKTCYQVHRQTYYAQHYKNYREQYLKRARTRREQLRNEFRERLIAYLTDKACELCGENDLRVLEFDHLDPTLKQFEISQATRLGYAWEATLTEIKKCRILCANCHKKHTAKQFNWYKSKLDGGTDRI